MVSTKVIYVNVSHRETYFLCYVTTATGWGFTSCHWHKKQAKMEHFLSTLALREHSNLAKLSFLFLYLFDFRNFLIYIILLIVGCWGECTVHTLMGVHPDAKICRAEKENNNPKLLWRMVQSSFGLTCIMLQRAAFFAFAFTKKARKGKSFCHLYEVKDKPANRLF